MDDDDDVATSLDRRDQQLLYDSTNVQELNRTVFLPCYTTGLFFSSR